MSRANKGSAPSPAVQLESHQDVAAYLERLAGQGDPQAFIAGLGHVARAKGMTKIAREIGVGRESLYKSLSDHGNPEVDTVLKVVNALGLQIAFVPKQQ